MPSAGERLCRFVYKSTLRCGSCVHVCRNPTATMFSPPSLSPSLSSLFFLLSSFMCVPRVPATFLQIFIPGVKRSWSLSPVYSPVLSLGRLSQWPFFVLTESDREEGIESQRGQRGSKWSEVRMKRVRRKITVKRERKQWVHTAFVFCFLWKLNKKIMFLNLSNYLHSDLRICRVILLVNQVNL